MKYEKIYPGFTVAYLHNSDKCFNCQLAYDSDSEDDVLSMKHEYEKYDFKKKSHNQRPLENFIVEAEEFSSSREKFPVSLKVHPEKPLKKKKNRNRELNNAKKKSPNSDFKIPAKGTLKRKRWYFNKLSDKNDSYEDDLYEDKKIEHFQLLIEDETDNSEKYNELETPSFPFSVSPRFRTPSPTYRDCYNLAHWNISRKNAEEYQYRKKMRRKLNAPETQKPQAAKEALQNRKDDVWNRLEEVSKILTEQQQKKNNPLSDSDDDEDHCYS